MRGAVWTAHHLISDSHTGFDTRALETFLELLNRRVRYNAPTSFLAPHRSSPTRKTLGSIPGRPTMVIAVKREHHYGLMPLVRHSLFTQ